MNRRDKQRMDDRRRESRAPKQNNCDLNSSCSSKSLMDNYFQSQKIIQSISDSPVVNEVKVTKMFKIPKKQPAKPGIQAERYNAGIDRSSRRVDAPERFNNWRRHSTDFKRIRLVSPSRRDRFEQRKTKVNSNSNNGYKTVENVGLKNRLHFNQPIDIIIADRAAPNGKISPENATIFLNEIKESVAKRIPTHPTYQTKFIDHRHESGLITITCADDFTCVFIQQKLTEKLSLWPGAKLEWSFGHFISCFINLIVPNSIGHLSEFLYNCKKTDSRMLTEKWRRIECEDADDDSGKLFKLAIDKKSYEIIKQQGNLVRCGDLSIKIQLDPLNETAEEERSSK